MTRTRRTSPPIRTQSWPSLLGLLVGAGLLAAAAPPDTHAQMETAGEPSDSPPELIAGGEPWSGFATPD